MPGSALVRPDCYLISAPLYSIWRFCASDCCALRYVIGPIILSVRPELLLASLGLAVVCLQPFACVERNRDLRDLAVRRDKLYARRLKSRDQKHTRHVHASAPSLTQTFPDKQTSRYATLPGTIQLCTLHTDRRELPSGVASTRSQTAVQAKHRRTPPTKHE